MSPGSRLLGLRFLERRNWSRQQESHLLSDAPKAPVSTTSTSPRDDELPTRSGSDRREKKVSWSRLRRTPASAETCAGLSRGCEPRLPGSFHDREGYGPHLAYSCMAAFVCGCGTSPIRRLLLDVLPTVDPAGPQRGANLTVRRSIDPREPCGFRWTPISTSVDRGLSHFHCLRGRDFAFRWLTIRESNPQLQVVGLTLYH